MPWRVAVLFLIIGSLAGCGGGASGGSADSSPFSEGGSSGTGVTATTIETTVAKGTINGFGGLSTGGIDYNIDAATISFNGQPGSADQLETGMVVEVDAEVDAATGTGTAENIVFDYNLVGVIDEINPAGKTVIALGQKVQFDEITTFKNTLSGDLSVGDVILVSGFTDVNERILASYIEKSVTGFPDAIFEGVLTQLETSSKTFVIGEQLVDYSGAQLLSIPNNILQSGFSVRITGSETALMPGSPDTVVLATSVEGVAEGLSGNPGENIRVEGLISRVFEPLEFRLDGNTVVANSSTQYANGVAEEIVVNARVFVEGTIDAAGVINAENIRFTLPTDVVIEAEVDAINVADNTLSVLGRTVAVDAFTILKDGSSANIQRFSLSDIVIGDRLKITGRDDGLNIDAARIDRVDVIANNAQIILEGVVGASVSNPRFSVAGLIIDTSTLQDLSGFSQGGVTPVTRSTFFASLQPEMVVRILGRFLAGELAPSRVEIVQCCNWEVYLGIPGAFIGGGNDVVFTWDGTLNTDILSGNVNATLSTNATVLGLPSAIEEVRIFAPGAYVFDTGLDPTLSTNF
ncbi:hypothetical protein MNBD_GAMMA13-1556, partial [hydrothermal vent metagenome]